MGQYFGRLESVCPLVGMWHSARQTQSFQVSECRTCDLASRLSEAGQAVQLHPEITVVTCLTNRSQKLAIIVYVGHMLTAISSATEPASRGCPCRGAFWSRTCAVVQTGTPGTPSCYLRCYSNISFRSMRVAGQLLALEHLQAATMRSARHLLSSRRGLSARLQRLQVQPDSLRVVW
jgi:hypothetical protein